MTIDVRPTWVLFLAVGLLPLGGGSHLGGPGAASATIGQEEKTPVSSSNPVSGDPDAIGQGRALYFKFCAPCHGPHADGESRFGKYAADLRKFSLGYRTFVVTVQNGRTGKQMPPWKEYLTEQQISQIAAYLESLAIEGADWR